MKLPPCLKKLDIDQMLAFNKLLVVNAMLAPEILSRFGVCKDCVAEIMLQSFFCAMRDNDMEMQDVLNAITTSLGRAFETDLRVMVMMEASDEDEEKAPDGATVH